MPSTSHTAISLLCALSIILLLHHIPSTGATKLKHPPSAATSSDAAIQCQVVVAGGGFGGVAAAFAAASRGVLTCLVSESQWLGGQATSQAVSAFDEAFSQYAAGYDELRNAIRSNYSASFDLADPQHFRSFDGSLNPGNCWVSDLCFDPRTGAYVLDQMAAQYEQRGTLIVFRGWYATKTLVDTSGAINKITGVVFSPVINSPLYERFAAGLEHAIEPSASLELHAQVVVDGTELGDLLPLVGADYAFGVESKNQTNEPDAPAKAAPQCVQAFTYDFYAENRPSTENHVIQQPRYYNASNYSLDNFQGLFFASNNTWYQNTWGIPYSFWAYRRIYDACMFAGNCNQTNVASYSSSSSSSATPPFYDVALINWSDGNDYIQDCGQLGCNIIDKPPAEVQKILARARQYALGFMYWMQTGVVQDNGVSIGYPNILLRTDIMPTSDGLAPVPYIREGRRVQAVVMMYEQDVASENQASPSYLYYRSKTKYSDSLGTARYNFDIHSTPACPYGVSMVAGAAQIPLGSLIPKSVDNLLVGGGKSIGTSHISNSLYRVHPCEWNIGSAAGAAAAFSVQAKLTPRQLQATPTQLRRLQYSLVQAPATGSQLYWWTDGNQNQPRDQLTKLNDPPTYAAAQMLAVMGIYTAPAGTLINFSRGQNASTNAALQALCNAFNVTSIPSVPYTCASALYDAGALSHIRHRGSLQSKQEFLKALLDSSSIQRIDMVTTMVNLWCSVSKTAPSPCPSTPAVAQAAFIDVTTSNKYRAQVEAAWRWGWLENDIALLPPHVNLGTSHFDPTVPLTNRSLVLWLWNAVKAQALGQ